MPDNLFYNTSAAGIVIVLRKNKPKDRKGKIVLVNASLEFSKGNPKNYLTEEAIGRIVAAYLKGEPLATLSSSRTTAPSKLRWPSGVKTDEKSIGLDAATTPDAGQAAHRV